MRFVRLATVSIPPLAFALLLAGCATAPKPAKPSTPAALPAIAPPPPGPIDWRDVPLTPGTWRYDPQSFTARFGAASAEVTIRCDKATRTILVTRAGATGPLTIKTSYGTRTIAADAPVAARDSLLDQIAFSRGRFTIESNGLAMVVMPAWAEPGRVVEDCRG